MEEELEEIEDLNEDEMEDNDFESEDEYKEKLEELDVDMCILETDIEVIEKILSEKNN